MDALAVGILRSKMKRWRSVADSAAGVGILATISAIVALLDGVPADFVDTAKGGEFPVDSRNRRCGQYRAVVAVV